METSYDDPIKRALDEFLEELKEAQTQKLKAQFEMQAADLKLARLRPKIIGLAALSDAPPRDEYFDLFLQETVGKGFTDAAWDVLMADGGFMTPLQVRDALIRMGYDITEKYANPLAVIHNILKRLVERKKAIQQSGLSGTEYKGNPSAPLTRRQLRLLDERQPEWWKHLKESGFVHTIQGSKRIQSKRRISSEADLAKKD